MKYAKLIALSLLLTTVNRLNAQKVCGAEMYKLFYDPDEQTLMVRIQVCREGFFKNHLVFHWGDGQIDSIPRVATANEGPDHVVDYYTGIHHYNLTTNEYMVLSISDEEVVDDFVNIDYSMGNSFTLSDSVLIYTLEGAPLVQGSGNLGPWPNSLGIETYDGAVLFLNLLMNQDRETDSLAFEVGEFPVAGYMRPASEEEYYMEGGLMFWDRPMVPGKYALASKIRQLIWTDNPINEGPLVFYSTITRAFMLVVDSNNIVSTVGVPDLTLVSVYPNPAHDLLQIEYGGLVGAAQLQVSNIQAQLMHQQELMSTAQLQSLQIDVSKWPAGMYFVEIKNEKGRVVKKVLVE